MKASTSLTLALSLLPVLHDTAKSATTLTADTLYRNNTPLPLDFGSNVSQDALGIVTTQDADGTIGTPDVALTWTTSGSPSNWMYHPWNGQGENAHVFQMASGYAGSIFSISFVPTSDTGIVFNGFNFIGTSLNDSYQFKVSLVNMTTDSAVWSTTTERWTTMSGLPFNNAPAIAVNYVGEFSIAYRLDIEVLEASGSGNAQNNMGIDDLSFAQTSIPEPSTYGIIGVVLIATKVVVRRCLKRKTNELA